LQNKLNNVITSDTLHPSQKNRCDFGPSAEQWHLHPKIKGLNPATGIGREKMAKNIRQCHPSLQNKGQSMSLQIWLRLGSTVVDNPTHYPCIEGTNAASATRKDKKEKHASQCYNTLYPSQQNENQCFHKYGCVLVAQ
jgi:hypothetical protein